MPVPRKARLKMPGVSIPAGFARRFTIARARCQSRRRVLSSLVLRSTKRRPCFQFHPGRDMHRLDIQQATDVHFLGPSVEIRDGADLGLARVPVSDLRGEKLDEAFLRIATSLGDQRTRLFP
jgi:hypothetical protein